MINLELKNKLFKKQLKINAFEYSHENNLLINIRIDNLIYEYDKKFNLIKYLENTYKIDLNYFYKNDPNNYYNREITYTDNKYYESSHILECKKKNFK